MRVQIFMPYCGRPNMMVNALRSVLGQDSHDWELTIIDDTTVEETGKYVMAVVDRVFPRWARDRTTIYQVRDPLASKVARGSRHGDFLNQAINDLVAARHFPLDDEIGILLCDDDCLILEYVTNLIKFFSTHPQAAWGYCQVASYNPFTAERWPGIAPRGLWFPADAVGPYGAEEMDAQGNLDASQVAWRLESGVPFPSGTKALDAAFYSAMGRRHGKVPFMHCIGQYKGVYASQLSHRQGDAQYINIPDLPGGAI